VCNCVVCKSRLICSNKAMENTDSRRTCKNDTIISEIVVSLITSFAILFIQVRRVYEK